MPALDSDLIDAQKSCNFVLFKPTKLPNDLELVDNQLRTESAEIVATYRIVLAGPNRKLSLKQFLYDWAPPAYDYPSLWRNAAISPLEETPAPKPFLVDQDVAWIGLNYRRQRAGSLSLMRTTIEITEIEGDFSDDEFIDIFRHLQPVDPTITAMPFAYQCQSFRYQKNASPVPLSYWSYTRKQEWTLIPLVPTDSTKAPINLSDHGYFLNSLFVLNGFEKEYYYEKRGSPGSYIRLLITPYGSDDSIPYPPFLGDQKCTSQTISINGIDIYHAYLSEEFGPHEAIWRHNNNVMLLLVKPARWTSIDWFHQLLTDITHQYL